MRIGLAAIILETNSFSPMRSDEQYFKQNGFLLRGDAVLQYHAHNVRNEIAGFLDVCRRQGTEVACSWAGWAVPYGMMPGETYRRLKSGILEDFSEQLDVLDGVYLALHGSMVVEGIPDPEGDLIAAVRTLVGDKLLVVTLDYHANVTRKMARHASMLVGYNSFPHDNMYETGQRAGELFHRYVRRAGEIVTWFVKLPLITPLEKMTVKDNPPMKALVDRADEIGREPQVCVASVFGVQPWNDIPELGSSIAVTVEQSIAGEGRALCIELADAFWNYREYYNSVILHPVEEAVEKALASDAPTVLLNEPSDNVGSGAAGDSSNILRCLIARNVAVPTILTICDPDAVQVCMSRSVGERMTIHVGGMFNTNDPGCDVTGTLRLVHDGSYRFRGPVQTGVRTSVGASVVLEFNEDMFLQVTSIPPYTIDPEHYRCMGLHPERMKLVGIKSQGSYKASYDNLPHEMLLVDSPGFSSSNMERIPYTKVDKDAVYPFNEHAVFNPAAAVSSSL